jgi:hypothetical protein
MNTPSDHKWQHKDKCQRRHFVKSNFYVNSNGPRVFDRHRRFLFVAWRPFCDQIPYKKLGIQMRVDSKNDSLCRRHCRKQGAGRLAPLAGLGNRVKRFSRFRFHE